MLNKTKKSIFGQFGEELATGYLIKRGYKIVARNHLIKWDEIDIVAKQADGTLVMCEVKTLKGNPGFPEGFMPEDKLNGLKYKKMARAAQTFAAQHPDLIDEARGWRLDLIAIVLDESNNLMDLRHYENI